MDFNHIKDHYRKEELPFVERVIEWVERAEIQQIPIRTDFVDPRQLQIIQHIVNSFMGLTIFFDGGYLNAERVRVMIAPDYLLESEEEMGLIYFKLQHNDKYNKLSHKDYLGALMHIGIKREKFGDIILTDDLVQFIVAEEIADYVRFELKQIGRTKVDLEEIKREALLIPKEKYETKDITVTSLRADNVIGHVYPLSRSNVTELIKSNRLKVNWQVIDKKDYSLEVGDTISVRGFGRFILIEENGETKKGKIKIKIGKLL